MNLSKEIPVGCRAKRTEPIEQCAAENGRKSGTEPTHARPDGEGCKGAKDRAN